jgi:hypothetical protein
MAVRISGMSFSFVHFLKDSFARGPAALRQSRSGRCAAGAG